MNEKFITRISFSLRIDNCLNGYIGHITLGRFKNQIHINTRTRITIKGFRFLWCQVSSYHTHLQKKAKILIPYLLCVFQSFCMYTTYIEDTIQTSHYLNPDEPLNYPFVKLSAYNNNVIIFPFISFLASLALLTTTSANASHIILYS